MQDRERAKKTASWSIGSMFKKLFGFIVFTSLIKMICFPVQPSQWPNPEDITSIDQVEVHWTYQEQLLIRDQSSQEMREELMLSLIKDKLKVKKAEEEYEKKVEQERFNHYMQTRIQGKTRSVAETLLSARLDMAAYGE